MRLQILRERATTHCEPARVSRPRRAAGRRPTAAARCARAKPAISLGLKRQSMVGPGARRRRHALDGVQPVHAIGVLGPAAGGELARVAQAAGAGRQEVGVEREDDVGAGRCRYCVSTYSPKASIAPARALSRLAGSY